MNPFVILTVIFGTGSAITIVAAKKWNPVGFVVCIMFVWHPDAEIF